MNSDFVQVLASLGRTRRAETLGGDPPSGGTGLMRCECEKLRNRILLALRSGLRDEVLSHCRRVEFPSGHVIYPAGAPVERVYFIDCGLVSLIKSTADGRSTEIGAVGTEGLVGVFAANGLVRPVVDYVVEVPVTAQCIDPKTLQSAMAEHPELCRLIRHALFLHVEQISQTAACNRLHSLEQRCCRWLLIAHDNAFSDHFSFTHEFLATLLGVQRPSISMIANSLQKRGLIRYVHGKFTILDRDAMKAFSCDCYETIREEVDALLGSASRD